MNDASDDRLTVPCRYCHVAAGQPCVNSRGEVVQYPHAPRTDDRNALDDGVPLSTVQARPPVTRKPDPTPRQEPPMPDPTDPTTGLVSGLPIDTSGPSDEEFRSMQITQLREAFEDVAEKIEAAEVAIAEADDLIMSFDLLSKDLAPRQPNVDEPWEKGRLRIDLDLPADLMNVLTGYDGKNRVLRVERAALVVYLDALLSHQHHLMHVSQGLNLTAEDILPEPVREPAPDVAVPAPAPPS